MTNLKSSNSIGGNGGVCTAHALELEVLLQVQYKEAADLLEEEEEENHFERKSIWMEFEKDDEKMKVYSISFLNTSSFTAQLIGVQARVDYVSSICLKLVLPRSPTRQQQYANLWMMSDGDLGFMANFLGIFIFALVIAYHYVLADPKYEAN
ncbi:Oligosaccaryltransferase [Cynara cardunculus var. scolymus]|uniref:Oligosaccaryltransferase n=1 Tax=Cynara cardunculus var. scolymus TaxID=59895 RepID=A0A118K430_CYNCS|nr:Oligosaccaryltransferase [Cynara cardunculus var. scolymus]